MIKISLSILCLLIFSTNLLAEDKAKKEAQFQIIQSAISHIDKDLSEDDFKQLIQKKYHATYRFLDKLSDRQKAEVYKYYKTESDFSEIRHKIFDLFFWNNGKV